MLLPLWPVRLRLILDNWQALTTSQREGLRSTSRGPGSFRPGTTGLPTRSATLIDELFVRYFVRNEPGGQEELTRLLAERRAKKP